MRTHGGNTFQSPQMLDFSANINPLGMPEAVQRAVTDSVRDCVRYPDPDCTELIRALAEFEQHPAEQIVCGSGAADLIFRIVHAILPHHALLCAPTFSEYEAALREVGCAVQEYPLNPVTDYQPDDRILSALTEKTDIVFLCTPNNPTGRRIPPALLKQIADRCRETGSVLVSDECFLWFSADAEQYSLRRFLHGHCIILNAFTKLFAMPGLRLGYALCGSAAMAEKLRGSGQFWSVSVPAQAAGLAALQLPDWIPETVRLVTAERAFLSEELRKSGVYVYDGDANFLLLRAPSDFAERMKQHRILIRKCADFHGLTDAHYRIAVRTHAENLALISAVREEYK